MKKFLSVVLVFATITCLSVGLTGCNKMFASKLKEEIVGTWVSPDIGDFTINKDGSFSGTLPFEILIDIEGDYVVNSGKEIIVEFYYSDEVYERILDVELKEDKLNISYFLQGTSGGYTRKTDTNYEEENNEDDYEYQEPEGTTNKTLKTIAEKNQDGVYDFLNGYNNSVTHEEVSYFWGEIDQECSYDNGGHLFVCGTKDTEIPIYNKNETMAIYSGIEEIVLIKITDDVRYTPDLNFHPKGEDPYVSSRDIKFTSHPFGLTVRYGSDTFHLDKSDELEINGINYDNYLLENTIKMKGPGGIWAVFYSIIDAEQGDKFTLADTRKQIG